MRRRRNGSALNLMPLRIFRLMHAPGSKEREYKRWLRQASIRSVPSHVSPAACRCMAPLIAFAMGIAYPSAFTPI